MSKPTLGTGAPIDVLKLIESRMLIQANSGGGKSYTVRRICEQTYNYAPQIVIDVEGEFHTLREKNDYIFAAPKGGDCIADIRSAALLARRILELGVSAIIDIYELGTQRGLFVKRFLESLVNSPRDLWRSLIVVVDEVHKFAPEGERCESTSAVIDLFTLGRKRGFCGIGATQRISKVHKDVAAECNNKLIGRCVLDIDIKRAAQELGLTSKTDAQELKNLEPGEFYAFGPALKNGVNKIQIGSVSTTHPKSGARALAPTPPSAKVKKILGQLADLPHEADEELKTVGELKTKIRQLEVELRKKPVAVAKAETKIETKIVEKSIIKPADLKRLEKVSDRLEARAAMLGVEVTTIKEVVNRITQVHKPQPRPIIQAKKPLPIERSWSKGDPLHHAFVSHPPKSNGVSNGVLPKGEATLLSAIIQYPGAKTTRLAVLTGYKATSRYEFLRSLKARGYITESSGQFTATDEGIAALPDVEKLPEGDALREWWLARLSKGEKAILELLVNAYPEEVSNEQIEEQTGYKPTSRYEFCRQLAAKELLENFRGAAKASSILFD